MPVSNIVRIIVVTTTVLLVSLLLFLLTLLAFFLLALLVRVFTIGVVVIVGLLGRLTAASVTCQRQSQDS